MNGRSGRACRRGESGQGMTEYLIILALIAIAAIGVYSFFGQGAVRQPPAAATSPVPSSAKDAAGAPRQSAPRILPETPVQAAAETPAPAMQQAPAATGDSRTAGTR